MESLLLGISPEYLYFKQGLIEPISKYHHPYFLAFTGTEEPCASTRQRLIDLWKKNKESQTPFSFVTRIGELETYRSFWDFGRTLQAFKIYTTESYRVPEVSDHLFFNYGVYTGEHDIPYQQRALVDLLSSEETWPFDSAGRKQRLHMLVYDIELTRFEPGKIDSPIDMIGYASSDILFESKKDLKDEIFQFDILDIPSTIDEKDIIQLVARDTDEEIDNISTFCKLVREYDIISGHNILGFDNRQIYGRIHTILKQYQAQITPIEREIFETFLKTYCRVDKSFHFGISSDVVQIYPCSFDTYLASRKFYPFLDSHSLKAVAPFLGVGVPNRLILGPSEIKLDARTMKYNRQDILEQMGVTLHLIQQTLPLSFTTGMPFDMLLDSGAVNMWDHMSLIRGAVQKKIIPATCRVSTIAQNLLRDFNDCKTKKDIATQAKNKREQLSKEFIRVVKYGSEMPDWMLYPYVIYNEQAKDVDERLNYHMPGGMTIKPDKDASSHFIPWYKVIVADVGAMYPTILKALNIGADTVRLCPKNETPDEWIWLKKIPTRFFEENDVIWRKISKEDSYADKGFMIGVKIDTDPGVVNCSMTGIMSMIARIKQELKEVKTKGNIDELSRLKMMYQSVKGARNAGSVDHNQRIVLVSPEGKYEHVKIGDFVDTKLKENGIIKEIINGTEFEIAIINDGWKAVSVNANGKTELKKVRQVIRHKYNGDLLKISTKSGSTVVTPNHSVFTISDNAIKEVSAENLKEDVLVAHVGSIPSIEQDSEINLINRVRSPDFYGFIERADLDRFNGYKEDIIKKNMVRGRNVSYVKLEIDDLRNMRLPEELLSYITIGSNGRRASRISSIISINADLATFLGHYISEGHISVRYRNGYPQHYISISASSKKMHEKIQDISKRIFDLNVYSLDRSDTVGCIVSSLHAKIVKYLLEDLLQCGNRSNCKRIPSEILSASKEIKDMFFESYMEGDGNYKRTMPSSVPLGRFTTNSRYLNEDIIMLQRQNSIKTNTYIRPSEMTFNTRMIKFFKGDTKDLADCFAIPPKKIEKVTPTSEYVYDISVEDNENFIDANGGIILHNTHGILAAPNVSGRQFNLWGAATITTKGQMILADTLEFLEKNGIRVVYGDTDGIYLGCSNSIKTIPHFSKALGVSFDTPSFIWLTPPEDAVAAIDACNNRWQKELSYPDFELEPEFHDAMIFVKHKNYLIFDEKQGSIEMTTKGNNFKGSDKANIARKALKEIMIKVLKENPEWTKEDVAREDVKESIMRITQEIVAKLDLSKVDIEDLTLIQQVKPASRYKRNQDGSMSTFGKRASALEKVIGEPLKTTAKYRFVVTKQPLPGIKNPSKSGVKPIDYMIPVDKIENSREIDLEWYKQMIENYIQGAFGLSQIQKTEQTGLDAWM